MTLWGQGPGVELSDPGGSRDRKAEVGAGPEAAGDGGEDGYVK